MKCPSNAACYARPNAKNQIAKAPEYLVRIDMSYHTASNGSIRLLVQRLNLIIQ